MLVLERKGRDVYHDSVKLTRVDQATKGEGKEVIKIEGLEGSNGAKWISLSKLHEGKNEVEVHAKKTTSTGSYTLTPEEKAKVDSLQAQIDKIKNAAKARYVPKPKFLSSTEIAKLGNKEKAEYANKVEDYLNSLRG